MERCIKPMFPDPLDALRLLQLADSALPIGGAAHSFGLETLAGEGRIRVEELERFLGDAREETGGLKGAVLETVRHSGNVGVEDVACFMPLTEAGSMRHPWLTTRLFIS